MTRNNTFSAAMPHHAGRNYYKELQAAVTSLAARVPENPQKIGRPLLQAAGQLAEGGPQYVPFAIAAVAIVVKHSVQNPRLQDLQKIAREKLETLTALQNGTAQPSPQLPGDGSTTQTGQALIL
ncbi:MAG: hypothetical protein WBK91_08560 [Alphaproteobacteria bacterium]